MPPRLASSARATASGRDPALMLTFWVSPTTRQDQISKTIGATLKGMRPDVPEHQFKPVGRRTPGAGARRDRHGLRQEGPGAAAGGRHGAEEPHAQLAAGEAAVGRGDQGHLDDDVRSRRHQQRAREARDDRLGHPPGAPLPHHGLAEAQAGRLPLGGQLPAHDRPDQGQVRQDRGTRRCRVRHGDDGALPLRARQGDRDDRLHRPRALWRDALPGAEG